MKLKRKYRFAPAVTHEVERLYRQGVTVVGIGEQLGIGSRVVEYILQQPRQFGCITLPGLLRPANPN
jgi:hypothetical protein